MTCIVGLVKDNHVYIGGDSAGISHWHLIHRADQKVFKKGDFVFGFTSSFRMGQLIRYKFEIPPYDPDTDMMTYMVGPFIDSLRNCLKEGGFASKENETESGGIFLVGFNGRLFKIESDYQVGESLDDYDAAGCGQAEALGALYWLTDRSDGSPQTILEYALEATLHHNAGIRPPFHVVSTENV